MQGTYIVISGPSGVGKGTIVKRLVDELGLALSTSMTTRDMRVGEVDGVDYYFTDKQDFERRINNNEFIEYATYNDNYYGTLKKEVQDKLDKGINVICEIEVQGAMQIKKLFSNSLLIYIMAPSIEELRDRLIKRNTETIDVIEKRIAIAKKEQEYVNNYDYVVVNDDLNVAVNEIKDIISKQK